MADSSFSPMRRIKLGELEVGAPLQFDIFDSDRRLLLRRGNRISSEAQLERLLREGVFLGESGKHESNRGDEGPAGTPLAEFRSVSTPPEVSAFHMFDDCARSLDRLLRAPPADVAAQRFAEQIGHVAARIQRLCRSDSDAAAAYVLLGQAPHFPVRQQINVAILSALMLSRLQPNSMRSETTVSAALTMNIGMMDLHEELYWLDQPLDERQRTNLRQHPLVSAQTLRDLGVEDPGWLQIVEQHHEALDGSGYPRGIKGRQVCKEARLVGIADRYNGMVTNRAYRHGMAPDFSLKELVRRDAQATDPALVSLLIRVIGVYPPGTVVALVNKEVGVVTNRLLDLKHPIVRTFYLDPYWPYDKPIKRFTGRMPQFAIAKTLSRDELNFTIDPGQLWPPVSLLGPGAAVDL